MIDGKLTIIALASAHATKRGSQTNASEALYTYIYNEINKYNEINTKTRYT